MWPTVERAISFVLAHQGPQGEIHWAVDTDGRPMEDALVTGCSSIHKSLECAVNIAHTIARDARHWVEARRQVGDALRHRPERFDRTWESKARYSMDWFYPVLGGVLTRTQARARLQERWTKIAEEAGIELVLEPVNTRHDHPGALLDRTEEAIYIAQKVASPNFKILYDIYHSSVEGENVVEMLTKHKNLIGYVQLADAPGRGEPGSGKIDWKPIMAAVAANYPGVVGLEYYPTQDTSKSIEYIKSFA